MSYFAVLVTTHVQPVPAGLEEPHGVFATRAEALEYLSENCMEWMANGGGWPFGGNIRLNEYATREAAERADVADGFQRGDTISGTQPIRSEVR